MEGREHIMELEDFLDLWNYAFRMLYKKDISLFRTDAQERSIMGRLAIYLQNRYDPFFDDLICIDLEYNREGKNVKRPHPHDNDGWMAPDILLHTRECSDNNIFYCEIKKKSDSKNQDAERARDAVRERNYQYGVNLFYIESDGAEMSVYTVCESNDGNKLLRERMYVFDPKQDTLSEKIGVENFWIYKNREWINCSDTHK